jgi:hypothetical protein
MDVYAVLESAESELGGGGGAAGESTGVAQ